MRRCFLLLTLLLASLAALSGCSTYGRYYANDGTVHTDIDKDDALRLSAAHDLACDAKAIRVYELQTNTGYHRHPSYLYVAEGCQKRATYEIQYGRAAELAPSPRSSEQARVQGWLPPDETPSTRHVLLSIVNVDPGSADFGRTADAN